MSFCTVARLLPYRFRIVLSSFQQHSGLPFADALSEERIADAFASEGVHAEPVEGDIYTPAVTLWAFLSQVLFKGEHRSCTAAVSRVAVLMGALGQRLPSSNTGAYCRARAKLPEQALRRVTREVASSCEDALPHNWFWHGRRVKLVDGSIIGMPDTQRNQSQYPQQASQKPGLGFPLIRVVMVLSLATAMICDMAIGPYRGKETGETALLRQLLSQLDPGDILLADRYYCSYFMICLIMAMEMDFVVRLHQLRKVDYERAQRLSAGDHIVTWQRPSKPKWMDQATYDQMPESVSVRLVEVDVKQKGFRVKSLTIATTLLDATRYTRDDLAELYHRRWMAELDIRTIKITLDMDVLRCKSPEMVRRELWVGLLAYNLIRQAILNAASTSSLSPRQLSFAAAMQQIAASVTSVFYMDDAERTKCVEAQLKAMVANQVGDRPNRVEPRAIKRRPKPHRLLTKPRHEARAELLAGTI